MNNYPKVIELENFLDIENNLAKNSLPASHTYEYEVNACKELGIKIEHLNGLKKIFFHGVKCSIVARELGYNIDYFSNMVRLLKEKEGFVDEFREKFKPYNVEEMDKVFWESMRTLIINKDKNAMKLYAEIMGYSKKSPQKVINQNIQNNLLHDKIADMFTEV